MSDSIKWPPLPLPYAVATPGDKELPSNLKELVWQPSRYSGFIYIAPKESAKKTLSVKEILNDTTRFR